MQTTNAPHNKAVKERRTPKPSWLKVKAPSGDTFFDLKGILRKRNLHSVCEEARCPNISECWNGGTATFMLMGDTCTRGCRFCAVKTLKRPPELDTDEPAKIAEAVAAMDLDYVVLTSVNRDDLTDQGSNHFAETIREIGIQHPRVIRECLIPDFQGDEAAIRTMVEAKPEVLAHNIETIRRLTPQIRDPRATYQQSLYVLRRIKELDPEIHTKSSIMVGIGETEAEVLEAMDDLLRLGVSILTIGQYLQPTKKHLKVQSFVHPETFAHYKRLGEQKGFSFVASGPLVRSSYRAGEFFIKNIIEQQRQQRAGANGDHGDATRNDTVPQP